MHYLGRLWNEFQTRFLGKPSSFSPACLNKLGYFRTEPCNYKTSAIPSNSDLPCTKLYQDSTEDSGCPLTSIIGWRKAGFKFFYFFKAFWRWHRDCEFQSHSATQNSGHGHSLTHDSSVNRTFVFHGKEKPSDEHTVSHWNHMEKKRLRNMLYL